MINFDCTVLGLITVLDLSVDKPESFGSFKAIITAIYVGVSRDRILLKRVRRSGDSDEEEF
jgi:hypothetical protein